MIRQTICALHFFSGFIPLPFFLLPLFSLFLFLSVSASFLTHPPLSLFPSHSFYLRFIGNASHNSIDTRSSDDPTRGREEERKAEGRMKIFTYLRVAIANPYHPIIRKRSRGKRDACAHVQNPRRKNPFLTELFTGVQLFVSRYQIPSRHSQTLGGEKYEAGDKIRSRPSICLFYIWLRCACITVIDSNCAIDLDACAMYQRGGERNRIRGRSLSLSLYPRKIVLARKKGPVAWKPPSSDRLTES